MQESHALYILDIRSILDLLHGACHTADSHGYKDHVLIIACLLVWASIDYTRGNCGEGVEMIGLRGVLARGFTRITGRTDSISFTKACTRLVETFILPLSRALSPKCCVTQSNPIWDLRGSPRSSPFQDLYAESQACELN